jgi:hypothetical protein
MTQPPAHDRAPFRDRGRRVSAPLLEVSELPDQLHVITRHCG